MAISFYNSYKYWSSNTVQVVKVDQDVPSVLTLYSDVKVSNDAFVSVDEDAESAAVSYDNFGDYVGWYWQEDYGKVWRLQYITYDESLKRYYWNMRNVYAFPDEGLMVDSRLINLWTGTLNGKKWLLGLCGAGGVNRGNLRGWDFESQNFTDILDFDVVEGEEPNIFGFEGKVYVLSGVTFYSWDGTFDEETGKANITQFNTENSYIPLVAISIPPGEDGGGSLLEPANLLSHYQRCWISPDGSGTVFTLPVYVAFPTFTVVVDRKTGDTLPKSDYTATERKIEFKTPPPEGINTYEVKY